MFQQLFRNSTTARCRLRRAGSKLFSVSRRITVLSMSTTDRIIAFMATSFFSSVSTSSFLSILQPLNSSSKRFASLSHAQTSHSKSSHPHTHHAALSSAEPTHGEPHLALVSVAPPQVALSLATVATPRHRLQVVRFRRRNSLSLHIHLVSIVIVHCHRFNSRY